MQYYEKLSADTLYLSPINPDDYELFCSWNNDRTIAERIGMLTTMQNNIRQRESLERMAGTDYNFTIVERKSNRAIGFCNIFDIRREDRSAEIGIMIGDTTMHNKGYGTKVGQLLFDFCFKVLNLNSVYARVASFNEPSLRLCKKLGFVEVGRRRQAWYNDGKYHDEVLVDILRSEYESRFQNDGKRNPHETL